MLLEPGIYDSYLYSFGEQIIQPTAMQYNIIHSLSGCALFLQLAFWHIWQRRLKVLDLVIAFQCQKRNCFQITTFILGTDVAFLLKNSFQDWNKYYALGAYLQSFCINSDHVPPLFSLYLFLQRYNEVINNRMNVPNTVCHSRA